MIWRRSLLIQPFGKEDPGSASNRIARRTLERRAVLVERLSGEIVLMVCSVISGYCRARIQRLTIAQHFVAELPSRRSRHSVSASCGACAGKSDR